MSFKDRFSRQAATYAAHRPRYPDSLFAFLHAALPRHELAWDAGTGNGQAAQGLASSFREVVASDPSPRQLQNAQAPENVRFMQAAEELPELSPGTVDLITVAQALHWFDRERFYAEVRRVLHPQGGLACWTYNLPRFTPGVDKLVDRFYHEQVGAFWDAERRLVETAYATLDFPFAEEPVPDFEIRTSWTLEHLLGYLRSWSATWNFFQAHGVDPVIEWEPRLLEAWGTPETPREGRWPLTVRLGRP